MEKIIVVDRNDNELGLESKEKCHRLNGILHRAITVFIFNNKNQLLITKRSKFKKLWSEYWETSCSTHIHKNEDYAKSAPKRIKKELGFYCKLRFFFKFKYFSKFKKIGSEKEICALFIGKYNGKVNVNPKEISDYKWISIKDLKKEIDKNPSLFCPWLKIAIKNYLKKRKKEKIKSNFLSL